VCCNLQGVGDKHPLKICVLLQDLHFVYVFLCIPLCRTLLFVVVYILVQEL